MVLGPTGKVTKRWPLVIKGIAEEFVQRVWAENPPTVSCSTKLVAVAGQEIEMVASESPTIRMGLAVLVAPIKLAGNATAVVSQTSRITGASLNAG